MAHEFYTAGQEDRASAVIAEVLAQHGPEEMLRAVDKRTGELLDATGASHPRWRGVEDAAITRHHLLDKARDLRQWLGFLSESGTWTRLGGHPGVLAVRQALSEACERVAATSQLRELDAGYPEVFSSLISRAVKEVECSERLPTGAEAEDLKDSRRYYSRLSKCEHLLAKLAEYPRTLPLGSADVVNAVLFANAAVAQFLESALDRRAQVIAACPALLPPPELPGRGSSFRCLPNASPPPRAVGSSWLLSPYMQQVLEDLRRINIEVLLPGTSKGLPLLEAQAPRVIESLHDLCRATLRAAHASYSDLRDPLMARIRQGVLRHLAQAEEAASPIRGPQRALQLAEEFEDVEAVVTLGASTDPRRLEEHLASSPEFRAQALAQFLRVSALRPLFFRALQRFEVPQEQLEELLAPYPELSWALEVHALSRQPSQADWQAALGRIQRAAAIRVRTERHSAEKRDAFAALISIAQRAAGADDSIHGPADVADLASLGRLQRLCLRFGCGPGDSLSAPPGAKRAEAPDRQPASAEETLQQLSSCMRRVFRGVKEVEREGQFLADAARLVRLMERDFADRQVDFAALLGLGPEAAGVPVEDTTVSTARALHQLWKEVVLAEEEIWHKVLCAPDGLERDALLASTGFCRMVWWQEGNAGKVMDFSCKCSPPKSALPDLLCGAFSELRSLGPALRLATTLPTQEASHSGVVDRMAAVPPLPPNTQGTTHFHIGTPGRTPPDS